MSAKYEEFSAQTGNDKKWGLPSLGSALTASTKRKLFSFSIIAFLIGTGLAIYQPIHQGNDVGAKSDAENMLGYWFYPRESNALAKYPRVATSIEDVTVVDQKIWLSGGGGLILFSNDGGQCWQQQSAYKTTGNESRVEVTQAEKSTSNTNGTVQESTLKCRLQSARVTRVLNKLTASSFLPSRAVELSLFPRVKASDLKDEKKTLPTTKKDSYQSSLANRTKQQSNKNKSDVSRAALIEKQQLKKLSPSKLMQAPLKSTTFSQSINPRLAHITLSSNGSGIVFNRDGIVSVRSADSWGAYQQLENVKINRFLIGKIPDVSSILSPGSGADSVLVNSIVGLTDDDKIIISTDNGKSWKIVDRPGSPVRAMALEPNVKFIMLGEKNYATAFNYRTKNWKNIAITQRSIIENIGVSQAGDVFASDERGNIFLSVDDGKNWDQVRSGNGAKITSFKLSEAGLMLATSDRGELLWSTEQGKNWQTIPAHNQAKHIAVNPYQIANQSTDKTNPAILSVINSNQLAISDDHGESWKTLLVSDYGRTGQSAEYQVSVARWWYLLCFVSGLVILFAVWPRKSEDVGDEGIAGMAASDRPLQPGDPDALNLGAIASDIASFLSNPMTTAPLTLAITGPWGCGKSSLMNLIRANLKDRGFLPVWFNAWHHQKGEQLLASLFAHINHQAIPPWFSFDGLWFRARLAMIRGRRHWFIVALMMFLLFLTWSINSQDNALLTKFDQIDWRQMWAGLIGNGGAETTANTGAANGGLLQAIASLFGVSAPIFALLRSVRGFGISPEKLVSVDQHNQNKKGYDPSARARFAEEFKDVTEALGKNKMVIFIDDLDRCSQENLIDILENINFLASSGDCYLLLGMAPKYIEACVANAYETLAKNIAEKEHYERSQRGSDGEMEIGDKEKHKFSFAHQYLEKMINIEVAIPTMTENSIDKLLNQADDAEKEESAEKKPLARRIISGLRPIFYWVNQSLPFVFVLVAIKAGWDYGSGLPPAEKPQTAENIELGTIDEENLLLLLSSKNMAVPVEFESLASEIKSPNNTGNRGYSIYLRPKSKAAEEEIKISTIGQGDKALDVIVRLNAGVKPQSINSNTNSPNEIGGGSPQQPTNSLSEEKSASNRLAMNSASEVATNESKSARQISRDLQAKAASLNAPKDSDSSRFSYSLLGLVIILFSSFTAYLYNQQHTKYAVDSDNFKNALNNWATWIQIRQETPRAIKRFLNHLRYQSIRNKNQLDESLLVAYATICFFEKSWMFDPKKFGMICDRQIEQLLTLEYAQSSVKKADKGRKKIVQRMEKVLDKVDINALRNSYDEAVTILEGGNCVFD